MSAVEDAVSLGKSMGLEVDGDDVEALVEDHNTELPTEELQDLQREQPQMAAEELSLEVEEKEDIPTSLSRKCLGNGENANFIEKYHLDKEVANHVINLLNDNTVFHIKQVIKLRQKQSSLDRFLVRRTPSEPEVSSSGEKRQKGGRTPEQQQPDVL